MLEVTESEKYRMLSNTDLLAIILGNESKKLEKSAEMLFEPTAIYCSAKDLAEEAEISQRSACKVLALSELMKRRKSETSKVSTKITNSKCAYEYVAEDFKGLDHEELFVLFLNTAKYVIKQVRFSVGAIDRTIFDVRQIMAMALKLKATSMIMQHNHPSGSLKPSVQDDMITKSLNVACMAMDIRLEDHIIVSENGYYSYCDNNDFERLMGK